MVEESNNQPNKTFSVDFNRPSLSEEAQDELQDFPKEYLAWLSENKITEPFVNILLAEMSDSNGEFSTSIISVLHELAILESALIRNPYLLEILDNNINPDALAGEYSPQQWQQYYDLCSAVQSLLEIGFTLKSADTLFYAKTFFPNFYHMVEVFTNNPAFDLREMSLVKFLSLIPQEFFSDLDQTKRQAFLDWFKEQLLARDSDDALNYFINDIVLLCDQEVNIKQDSSPEVDEPSLKRYKQLVRRIIGRYDSGVEEFFPSITNLLREN